MFCWRENVVLLEMVDVFGYWWDFILKKNVCFFGNVFLYVINFKFFNIMESILMLILLV